MAELHPILHDRDSTPESLSGTLIGRFRIGDRLGGGGMGEVYRAQDPKLKRTVAVKRLAPSLRSDGAYRHRFLEEAERVSSFTDAHVASLYDVLEENGEIFLVMEYIEGETLRQRLRRPLTLEEFFKIATQCAEGLAAAHAHGIVHCDIKPENIMLTSAGQVKILDFGVAKYLPRSDQSSTIDRSGTMAGTPAYMSPEVLLEQVPDGRADVFSLGVVFYEALTGQHPFLASSFVATTDRIRNETPTPIRIFNRRVPEGLVALVNKALAKDPALRYQGAPEVLDDLRLVQAGLTPSRLEPVLPPPRPMRKSNWVIGIAMSALIIAAVFIAYHRAQSKPVLNERGWVLISDLDSSGTESVPEQGVREALTIAMQQSRYVNVYPRSRVHEALQRMQKPDVQRVDENLGREICRRENLQILLAGSIVRLGPETQITIRAVTPDDGSTVFAKSTHFREGQFFDKADSLVRSVRESLGESVPLISKSTQPLAKVTTKSLPALQLYTQAKDFIDQGKEDEAGAPLQGALQLDPNFAMAHLLLGEHYLTVANKNEKAVAELKRAYDLRHAVTDREQRNIEADYYGIQERYEDAIQALTIYVSMYPDDPQTRLTLAEAYNALGQGDKSIAEFRQVVKLDPHSVTAYSGLMWGLAQRNDNDEALRVYQDALQRNLDSPPLHWAAGLAYLGQGKVTQAREQFRGLLKSSVSYRDLGELYLIRTDLYQGKLQAAVTQLQAGIEKDQASPEKGIQLFRRDLLAHVLLLLNNPRGTRSQADAILDSPADDRQTDDVLSAGVLYARSGDAALARQVLRQLESIRTQTPTPRNRSSVLRLTAEIALAEGRPAEAVQNFTAAGADHADVRTHLGLARAYEAQRDWTRAAREWTQVIDSRGEILAANHLPTDYSLAHLQLARSYRQLNNVQSAREHYQEFLDLWRQGDDSPLRRQAATELKKLPQGPVIEKPAKTQNSAGYPSKMNVKEPT
jgi:eukaryotic-like serine/threonine-protein kinase